MSTGDEMPSLDRRVTKVEDCIVRQVALVGNLAAKGQDTGPAQDELERLMSDLKALYQQRCCVADGNPGAPQP